MIFHSYLSLPEGKVSNSPQETRFLESTSNSPNESLTDIPGHTICKGTKAWYNTIPAALPAEKRDQWSWGWQLTAAHWSKKNIPTLWIDDLLWQVKNGNHRWNNTKDSDGFRWIQMDSDGFSECAIPKFIPVKIVKSATNRLSEIGPTVHRSTRSFSFRTCSNSHRENRVGTSLHMSETSKGKRMSPRTRPRIPGSPGQGNINCKDRGHHSHGFPCGNSFLCRALGQW